MAAVAPFVLSAHPFTYRHGENQQTNAYCMMAALDPVVDLYNAVSLLYAVPVGGENLEAYNGNPRLNIASGSEPFDSMKEGQPTIEYPDAGEVVWCDDSGVTCRRRTGDKV